ncbi:MAG: hypothetical protein PHY80_05610 [Rickettsiales bacterium]|nr:hypothetical protein [Rickettsiales bacterium]
MELEKGHCLELDKNHKIEQDASEDTNQNIKEEIEARSDIAKIFASKLNSKFTVFAKYEVNKDGFITLNADKLNTSEKKNSDINNKDSEKEDNKRLETENNKEIETENNGVEAENFKIYNSKEVKDKTSTYDKDKRKSLKETIILISEILDNKEENIRKSIKQARDEMNENNYNILSFHKRIDELEREFEDKIVLVELLKFVKSNY